MLAGIATYEEIRRFWDINDVARWHELLDAKGDEEWFQSQEK